MNSKKILPSPINYVARVITRSGSYVYVEKEDGEKSKCIVGKKALNIVCGDLVNCTSTTDHTQVIHEVLPRKNILGKKSGYGQEKNSAANIDYLIIVISILPSPSIYLIDRYLAVAENIAVTPLLILNKIDLPDKEKIHDLVQSIYAPLGYPIFLVSATCGTGLTALKNYLSDSTSILVGQSGVGKSSLVNALHPNIDITTEELSKALGQGKHTTRNTTLYRVSNDSWLIDSPGVQQFIPNFQDASEINKGFIEIASLAIECKFKNCSHTHEPKCAIIEAQNKGKISSSRLDSYRKLFAELRENNPY